MGKQEEYAVDPNSIATLSDAKQTLFEFGIGFSEQVSTDFSVFQSLGLAHELAEMGLSNGSGVSLRKGLVGKLNLGIGYSLLKADPYEISIGISAMGSTPGNFPGFKVDW